MTSSTNVEVKLCTMMSMTKFPNQLYGAAEELERQLTNDGIACEANHSEKGWVEVTILNKQ
jgi:hypothetical protein